MAKLRSSVLLLSVCAGVQAQTTLSPVTVTGKAEPVPSVAGWGDVPLAESPFQAFIVDHSKMRDLGVQRLADVVRLDPAVSDAYNTEGYWDYLTVRGFVIDNRFNYRRDGLPINAQTSIPLDNKDRVEILKGTSGLQAGTSAPGGLVNFVVKRPTSDARREVRLAWRERGSLLGAVDWSDRFGDFGLRVNAAAERFDPKVRDAKGERSLLAVAGDWRLGSDSLLEAEFETSHRRQPSVPGFSMLGGRVPAPVDPRINLNNQPWSLPVVLDATTASLRYTQSLGGGWRWTAHAATQRLKSDDRIAFPFGCSAEGAFDRYCSDGTYDLYDFRSEGERRRTDAVEVAVHGSAKTGAVTHTLSAGLLHSRFESRFGGEAFAYAGVGNVDGTLITPAAPVFGSGSPNRDERSTELFVRDAAKLTERTTLWLGLRHTKLERESSAGTSYSQSFTTPWLAASYALTPRSVVYASWGRGVESDVAPNLPQYANRGQALPALRSRQMEAGVKVNAEAWVLGAAVFEIERPTFGDFGACDATVPGSCTRAIDGSAQHRGVELTAGWESAPWSVEGGLQWLQARRQGAADAAVNGKRPPNVPEATLKLQARYDVASVPGLAAQVGLVAEGDRIVLADNSVSIPGHGRVDAGLRYAHSTGFGRLTWRAGIDNLFDRRAWRESPLQFGHVYLFPLAPRTLRVSLEAAL